MAARNQGKVEVSVMGLVLLGVATVVATGVVFLFGIYVGKSVTEERLAAEQQVVRLEVPGSPEPSRSGEVEVTFWDRLGNEEEPAAEPTGEPEPTPTETTVRVAPPGTAPAPTPSVAPTAAPTPVTPAAPVAEPTRSALRGTYQVQVQALADRSSADRLARDLRARGYEADVSAAKVGGQTLYRVRVGTFATENDAREVVAKLRREGYAGAFLAAGGSE